MSKTNHSGEATSRRHQRSHPVAADAVVAEEVDEAPIVQSPLRTDPRLAQLRHLSEIIGDAGAALSIPPERLAAGEALERLEVITRLTVEQLGHCTSARVQEWFAALADDLALDLRLDGLDPDLPSVAASLRAGGTPSTVLQGFQAEAQEAVETQGDAISVEARLSIGKTRAVALARDVVARRPGVAAPDMIAVFYTTGAWNALISLSAVPYLEQSGLVRANGRVFVLLCDAPGYLAGAALECLGAALPAAPDWLPMSPAAFRQFVAREEVSRRLLAEESGWPDAPRVLTTEMLHLVARIPGLETTLAHLAALRTELAAISLASVVRGGLPDGPVLHFAGVRPATCRLPAAAESQVSPAAGEALARLAEWATRRGTIDTLIIARECLSRELPSGRQVSLAEVAQAAVGAVEAAKANFTRFVRGQTDRYFAARQTAHDAVAEYGETVRKAVSDLTSDVVDNVYRTVGLLVAVVIAGLIQPDISPRLALLASILYSAYIAFVVYFLLRARDDHFMLEQAALTARLAGMSELTTAESKRIREPALSADAYYQRYMARARRIYFALLALGVLIAIILLIVVVARP